MTGKYEDRIMKCLDIAEHLNDLDHTGLQSLADALGVKNTTIKDLEKNGLFTIVAEELDRESHTDFLTRWYVNGDEKLIGIPYTQYPAEKLNDKLESLNVEAKDSSIIEIQRDLLDETKIDNDVFKIGFRTNINVLKNKFYESLSLLRMICTNRSTITTRSCSRYGNISNFEFSDIQMIQERANRFIDDIFRKSKKNLCNVDLTLRSLRLLMRINNEEKIEEFKKLLIEEIPKLYETPQIIDSIDSYKSMPQLWKQTALIKDKTVYDLWNDVTYAITREDEKQHFSAETKLDFDINATSILMTDTSRNIVAIERTN